MKKDALQHISFVFLLLWLPIAWALPSVGVGQEHSVVLQQNGTVWAWGENYSGQLGNGSTRASELPVAVSGLPEIAAISVGGYHSLALAVDGSLWAWGNNRKGQLGDGTTDTRLMPIQIAGLAGVVAIATGMYHSVALKGDGTVWSWGGNSNGQLGDGTVVDRSSPSLIAGLADISNISSGYWHTYALDADQRIWLWGYNSHGPPVTSADTIFASPVQFPGSWEEVVRSGQQAQEVVLPDNTTMLIAKGVENSVMMRPDGVVLQSGIETPLTSSSAPPPDAVGALQNATEVVWTGALSVVLKPASAIGDGAMWRVGGVWRDPGETAFLAEGHHLVEFAGIKGWTAPAAVDVSVVKSGSLVVDATYTAQSGHLSIQIDPPAAVSAGARWRVDGGAWRESGAVVRDLLVGEHVVEYLPVSGWALPEADVVVVADGEVSLYSARYEQHLASMIVHMGPSEIAVAGGQWRVVGGRWHDGAMEIVNLIPGRYTLEFLAVDGWNLPQPLIVDVGVGGVEVVAAYVKPAPVVVVDTGGGGDTQEASVDEESSGSQGASDSADAQQEVADGGDAAESDEVGSSTDTNAESTLVSDGDADEGAIDEGDSVEDVVIVGPEGGVVDEIDEQNGGVGHFSVAGTLSVDFADEAQTLNAGGSVVATISFIGDATIYSFEAERGRRYLFRARESGMAQLSIYDEGGSLVHTQAGDSQNNELRFAWKAPTSATYFTKIEFNDGASTGDVELSVAMLSTPNDFDGDGKTDVLSWSEMGAVSLMHVADGKVRDTVAAEYQIDEDTENGWKIRAIGDFDGDLKADILWRAKSGHTVIWMMDEGRLDERSGLTSEHVAGQSQWYISHTGDFNGDGKSDLLWHHQRSGRIAIWLMDGVNVLSESGLALAQAGEPDQWRIEGVDDFNADGKSDLLWRHQQSGHTAIWLMDGLNHTDGSGLTTEYVSRASQWEIVSTGDFDGDGRADLLWRKPDEGYLFIWFMSGIEVIDSGYITNYVDAASTWEIAQVGDFNGDGRADVLWRESGDGLLYVWVMDGLLPVDSREMVVDEPAMLRVIQR